MILVHCGTVRMYVTHDREWDKMESDMIFARPVHGENHPPIHPKVIFDFRRQKVSYRSASATVPV